LARDPRQAAGRDDPLGGWRDGGRGRIFGRRQEAEEAVAGLMAAGLRRDRISLLTPAGGDRLSDVPTTEAEAPGVGTARSKARRTRSSG
jgi:hypothetical protein